MLRTRMPAGSVSSLIEGRDNDVHMCKKRQARIQRECEQLSRHQQKDSDLVKSSLRRFQSEGKMSLLRRVMMHKWQTNTTCV